MARNKLTREGIAAAAAKWAAGYTSCGPALLAGVANPKRDPTQAAIAAQNLMQQNLMAAITNLSWANGLQRSGLAGWQSGMRNKTAVQLGTRATVGQPHVATFLNAYAPAIQQQIAALPARGDFATNQQRSNTLNAWAHSQKGKFRKLWRGT